MINVRFKIGSIIIALLGAFLIVNFANAQINSGNFTLNIENNPTFCNAFVGSPTCIYLVVENNENFIFNSFELRNENDILVNAGNLNVFYTVSNPPFLQQLVGANDLNGGTDDVAVLNSNLKLTLFYFDYVNDPNNENLLSSGEFFYSIDNTGNLINQNNQNLNNQTWGNSGIWGDEVTTEIVKEDLVASVQTTGFTLWPLLIFTGVALAFAIFLQLMFLTNKSIKPNKNAPFDTKKFNSKADQLESFYAKTGGASDEIVEQITKRKRGRPKKQI